MTAATDRLSDGYVPDFDLDLEVGRQGELFVTDLVQMLKDGAPPDPLRVARCRGSPHDPQPHSRGRPAASRTPPNHQTKG